MLVIISQCGGPGRESYVAGNARGGLGSLKGDVLHGQPVALRPQRVPRLLVLDLQPYTVTDGDRR